MICSRRQANVDESVAALRREGLDVKGVACHVGSLEQVQQLIQVPAVSVSSVISCAELPPLIKCIVASRPPAAHMSSEVSAVLRKRRKHAEFHTQAALSEFRRQHIDILVSNAAVNPAGGPILQMDDSVINKILEVRACHICLELQAS